jgi:hypothetical protein
MSSAMEIAMKDLGELIAAAASPQSAIDALKADYAKEVGKVVVAKEYGVTFDGVTDDTAALQTAATLAENGFLWLEKAASCFLTNEINIPVGCKIMGNGATLNFNLSGNTLALVMNDNCSAFDLTANVIEVTAATGGGQNQCPIVIGDYGIGTGYSNLKMENITVHTQRSNGNGIFITGDSHNIEITNLTIPNSVTMGRPILVHWGGADSPSTGTTHPYNINIKNVKIGAQTLASSEQAAIFISGAYNINVDNVEIDETYRSAFTIFSGDYGFEYAPANVKPLALKGIKVTNVSSRISRTIGFYVNGQAPLYTGTPQYHADIIFENCSSVGDKSATVNNGISIMNVSGVTFKKCNIINHNHGFAPGSNLDGVVFDDCLFDNNRLNGIYISNGTREPRNLVIQKCLFKNNGENGSGLAQKSGLYIGIAKNVSVQECQFGDLTSEPFQLGGIRVENTVSFTKIRNNHVHNVASGGTAYSLGSGGDYQIVDEFISNSANPGITYKGGATIYTIEKVDTLRRLRGTAAPTSLTWTRGDFVENSNPAELGSAGSMYVIEGWVCVTSGTPGTWLEKRTLTGN